MASICTKAKRRMNFCFPHMCAILPCQRQLLGYRAAYALAKDWPASGLALATVFCSRPVRLERSRGSRVTKREPISLNMGLLSLWSVTVVGQPTRKADVATPRSTELSPRASLFWAETYDYRFLSVWLRRTSVLSSGFNLPVGLFQRSQFGKIPEYHTSADNLDFIRPSHFAQSYRLIAETIAVIDNDATCVTTIPKCEPQLGKRGLYAAVGGDKDAVVKNMAMLWVLNFSDGTHSLLDIAERANLPFAVVRSTAEILYHRGLLFMESTLSAYGSVDNVVDA